MLGELIEKPRYRGESIVNLMASILEASGGRPGYPPLEGLDRADLQRARSILLIIVDGLGYEFLASITEATVLRRHLARSLTTVFPPTTAAAVTTYMTGLAPQQHGLTGWFLYLRELGTVVTVLPFTTRLGNVPLQSLGLTAEDVFGHTPVFDLLQRRSVIVAPADIARSPYNAAHAGRGGIEPYRGMDGFFGAIERTVAAAREPTFVYAYWPEMDRLAHAHGIGHPAVRTHLKELDERLGESLAHMAGNDCMVLLSADHGFVDVPPSRLIRLSDHPALRDMLLVPLCGEPRAAYCYALPSRRRDILSYFETELAEYAACVPSEALIENGYFGPGDPHPELRSRVGDYTILMRDGCGIVDELPGERRFTPRGMHGGGSSAEIRVPLIVAAV
jgi:predicted AlkP superfamily pyrophosphatase or phosphodiesterase